MWMILSLQLHDYPQPVTYPFYGSWILALLFDIPINTFSVAVRNPTHLDVLSTVFAFIRMCLLISLVCLAAADRSALKFDTQDEENIPVLGSTRHYGSIPPLPNTDPATTVQSGDLAAKDSEDEADRWWTQKRRDPSKNWRTYLASFLVFVPSMWPSKRPLLQLNIGGIALCLLAMRVVEALVPLQLSLLIDMFAKQPGYLPWKEIGLFGLLRLLQSSSGLDLLRELLWHPVESYARKVS